MLKPVHKAVLLVCFIFGINLGFNLMAFQNDFSDSYSKFCQKSYIKMSYISSETTPVLFFSDTMDIFEDNEDDVHEILNIFLLGMFFSFFAYRISLSINVSIRPLVRNALFVIKSVFLKTIFLRI